MALRCTDDERSATFAVRVSPRASQSRVEGLHENLLRVRLAAPPADGKANDELVRLLADLLATAPRDVEIVSGHTSRTKTVRVRGATCARVERLIDAG